MAMPNFAKLRDEFPMLKKSMHGKPLVYLDTAATAQKPQCVIDSLLDFYQNHYSTVHRAIYDLAVSSTNAYQNSRETARSFLNANKSSEIIFTRGTTESINMIAYSFCKAFVGECDEIIISEIEHHSNLVPWQLACEDRGANLKVIPCNDKGELILEKYESLLTEKTKLVAVGHISNALGTINPIKEIIDLAHNKGAKVLIDAAQSAPHLPLDVKELDVDFLVFSGHKAYGPTGVGVLFGKEELLELMPPYQGGGDMISHVDFKKTTYNTLPLKFEAGTPMIAEVIALGTALQYLKNIGLSHIEHYENSLLKYATKKIEDIPGLRIIGTAAQKGALISFVVDGIHHLDLGTLLDLKGIAIRTGHHCAQPAMRRMNVSGTARASFAFYNTEAEIDYFIDSLSACIHALRA